MFHFQARIEEIDSMDEERAYLDQSLKIPMIKGYKDNPSASVEHLSAHPHVEHPPAPCRVQ